MTYQWGYVKSLLAILSFFSETIDTINSHHTLNFDLKIIKNWAYQLKMQFKSDPKKQANEAILGNQIHVHTLQLLSITIWLHVLIKSTWMLTLIQS